MLLQWVTRIIKKLYKLLSKADPFLLFVKFLNIFGILTMVYGSSGYYMIKLIKITKQYIISAYTTDRHILIIGISLLQEGWRWHCCSHPAKLCLSAYQVTFDYSTLKTHISKTTNDRNKRISDSESRLIEGKYITKDSSFSNNIHAKRDAQKHCFIYSRTTLSYFNFWLISICSNPHFLGNRNKSRDHS